MTKSSPPPSISESSKSTREEQARALCLRLLTARARTRAELAGQLVKRGYPDDVAATVLNRLADVGLIDDAEFAEQWVRSRRANAGKSKRALAAELRTKGVDDDVIAETLDNIEAAEWRVRAEELVQTNCAGRTWTAISSRWRAGSSGCWRAAGTARRRPSMSSAPDGPRVSAAADVAQRRW